MIAGTEAGTPKINIKIDIKAAPTRPVEGSRHGPPRRARRAGTPAPNR